MRENRTYGSEGGEGRPFPTPIARGAAPLFAACRRLVGETPTKTPTLLHMNSRAGVSRYPLTVWMNEAASKPSTMR